MTAHDNPPSCEQRARIVEIARTWLGTPYHHHARVRGAGVDCAQLLCAVYHEAGVVPELDTGHYPHDWHLHRSEELFVSWLLRFGWARAPGEAAQPGDVAVFRYGRAFSHGAIMVDTKTCIHSYIDMGVIVTRLDEEPLAGRAHQFWSIHGR